MYYLDSLTKEYVHPYMTMVMGDVDISNIYIFGLPCYIYIYISIIYSNIT